MSSAFSPHRGEIERGPLGEALGPLTNIVVAGCPASHAATFGSQRLPLRSSARTFVVNLDALRAQQESADWDG